MSRKQTTEYEQWKQIAEQINAVEREMRKLHREMSSEGDVPKSVYGDQSRRVSDALTKLKSDLEDRMFEEHPDRASTHEFYGRGSDE